MVARTAGRRLAAVAGALAGAALLGALFATTLVAKERDNRFCVACHLHDDKLRRMVAGRPTDLAGWHHARDASVGCIGCHGGADPMMRGRVWVVAGLDTLRFLAGTYEEPGHMRLPLRDADCRVCHTPIVRRPPALPPAPAAAAPADPALGGYTESPDHRPAGTAFHPIREHASADVRCVRCHTVHTTDSDAGRRFVSAAVVQPICRECHPALR